MFVNVIARAILDYPSSHETSKRSARGKYILSSTSKRKKWITIDKTYNFSHKDKPHGSIVGEGKIAQTNHTQITHIKILLRLKKQISTVISAVDTYWSFYRGIVS